MKKLYILTVILFTTVTSFGQQAPPFLEPFNYTNGQTLQSQPSWTPLNTGDDLLIATGNLTYTGIPTPTGNKLTFGGTGIDSARDFALQTATTYYSVVLNVTDLTVTTSTTGGYCLGLVAHAVGASTNFGATLWIKKIDGTTFNIGINPRTTAASTIYSPTVYSINTNYFVVANYAFNASAGDDVVKLWVNPTLGGAEPAAIATATNTGGTDLASTGKILIRQGSATDTPNIEIDELRVALNWADATTTVVPLSNNQFNEIAGFSMYPNPVSNGKLFISSDNNIEKTVAIYDLIGKEIINQTVTNELNISSLTAGVYVVKVTEEGKTATRKLIVR